MLRLIFKPLPRSIYFIAAKRPSRHTFDMPDKDALWISNHAELRLTATPVLYHCEPIWSWKTSSLPDHAIWGVLDGSGTLTHNGASYGLNPGICFLFSPNDQIEAEQKPLDPLSLFVARFEILNTEGETMPAQELTVPTGPIQTSNPTTLKAIANLALAWDAENDIEKRIQDHALRMLLLLIADASSASYDERIAQASSLIDSDLARKWTLEEISSKSELSPSQFSRLFTKHFGEPPIQNLIHRRMKEAKRLVLETSLSIGEICAAVGYENQSFFERQFLKHVGFDAEALRRNRAI